MRRKPDGNRTRKALSTLLLLVMSFGFSASLFLATPRPAQAQTAMAKIVGTAQEVLKDVKDFLLETAVPAAGNAVGNMLEYVINQIAYQAAVALTSDCGGQTICWDSKSFNKGVQDAFLGGIGEAIGTLNQVDGIKKLGLDLCEPKGLDFKFKLNVGLPIMDEYKPPEPKCNFNNILKNWETAAATLNPQTLLSNVSMQFVPGQSPASAVMLSGIGVKQAGKIAEMNKKIKAQTDAAAGGGFSAVVDSISGRIKSPAGVTKTEFDVGKKQQEEQKTSGSAGLNAQVAGNKIVGIIASAAGTFAKTLASRLWNKLMNGLMSSEALIENQPDLPYDFMGQPMTSPGRVNMEKILSSRYKSAAPREPGAIDPISDFAVCPPEIGGRKPDHCTIDGQLAAGLAIATFRPMTVREALKSENNFLHGDWKLIPATSNIADTGRGCYAKAYCEGNLKKLRAMRVIPIGWEIAAQQAQNEESAKTLNEVIGLFNDCNDKGQMDSDHPYCHLVDPDWVLKAPPVLCKALTYGSTLATSLTPMRNEECVDRPSCLKQDDMGKCVGGYGYCVAERNSWRFDGDSCPAYYASCRTVTDTATGKQANYLTSTVDAGICGSDNVGCAAYALQPNPAAKADDPASAWLASPLRYLNRQAEKCVANDDGCTSIAILPTGRALNLVQNGGFEALEDLNGDNLAQHAKGWFPWADVTDIGDNGFATTDGRSTAAGQNAIYVDSHGIIQDGIRIRPNKTHSLAVSFLAPPGGSTFTGTAKLIFYDENGATNDSLVNNSIYRDFSTNASCDVVNHALVLKTVGASGLARISCTFMVLNDHVAHARLILSSGTGGETVIVDNVMLEEGQLTNFAEAYGGSLSYVNVKVAPPELNCQGTESDQPACAKYAGKCLETEIGCDRYTPKNGDPAVPAIISPADRCPAECVGYSIFKQEATSFEQERKDIYFIPSTAQVCTAADVGCTAFTDVESEQIAYFKRTQSCQLLSDPDSQSFYTWEGSDTSGYVIRQWTLKATDTAMTDESSVQAAQDMCADAAVCNGNAGKAPCTSLKRGTNAGSDFVCNDVSSVGRCTRIDVLNGDFDCREFYDKDGNRHFRRISRTIMAADDCRYFRITARSNEASVAQTDCENSAGVWNSGALTCTYRFAPSFSDSCGAQAASCRAYKGNAAANVRVVVRDDFETWPGSWTNGAAKPQSAESVIVGGHSMLVSSGNPATRDMTGILVGGRSYTIDFWARGSGFLDVRFGPDPGAPAVFADSSLGGRCVKGNASIGSCAIPGEACVVGSDTGMCEIAGKCDDAAASVCSRDSECAKNIRCVKPPVAALSMTWKLYSVGPVFIPAGTLWSAEPKLVFKSGANSYVDNVTIREVQDNIYVIRNSWRTPASCDRTADGAPSLHEMYNCRAYTNTAKNTVTVRQFSQFCHDRAVGCNVYANTQNTRTNPYEETWNAVCRYKDKDGKYQDADGKDMVCADNVPCPCDYAVTDPVSGALVDLAKDVCRVPFGNSTCRFQLNGWQSVKDNANPDVVRIPADERLYLAVDPKFRCAETAVGCRTLGKEQDIYEKTCVNSVSGVTANCSVPGGCKCEDTASKNFCVVKQGESSCKLSLGDGIVNGWGAVALKDDPAKYAQILCPAAAVGCNEYKTVDGMAYFKDPGSKVCEYKENVPTEDGQKSGWFRKSDTGLVAACSPGFGKGGTFNAIPKQGDVSCTLDAACTNERGCPCPTAGETVCSVASGSTGCGYRGWVGTCPVEYDRCEEFVDPVASSQTNPLGAPYYYMANDKLDKKSCAGGISLKQGCVAFNQTSLSRKNFSSFASYAKEAKSGTSDKVAAVNCEQNVRDGSCEFRCLKVESGKCYNASTGFGASCSLDSDCAGTDKCRGTVVFGDACNPANAANTGCPAKFCEFSNKICAADNGCSMGERCLGWACKGEAVLKTDKTLKSCVADEADCTSGTEHCDGGYCKLACDTTSCATGEYCASIGTGKKVCKLQGLKNDANVVIQVRRDRDCAKWYECKNTSPIYDVQANKWKPLCTAFSLCSQADTNGDQGMTCKNWENRSPASGRLTPERYASRDVTYKGLEYSGYSNPNAYPAESIGSVKTKTGLIAAVVRGSCKTDADCPADPDSPATDDNIGACVMPDNKSTTGTCAYDLFGGPASASKTNPGASLLCRAYPEQDAPFGRTVLLDSVYTTGNTRPRPDFKAANVCTVATSDSINALKDNACDCAYARSEYARGTSVVFSPNGTASIPSAICTSGDPKKIGLDCSIGGKTVCQVDDKDIMATCSPQTKLTQTVGWQGICVDFDTATPIEGTTNKFRCLQWLPVDQISGVPDIYNQYAEAGFSLNQDLGGLKTLQYCVEKKGSTTSGTEVQVLQDLTQPADPNSYVANNYYGDWLHMKMRDSVSGFVSILAIVLTAGTILLVPGLNYLVLGGLIYGAVVTATVDNPGAFHNLDVSSYNLNLQDVAAIQVKVHNPDSNTDNYYYLTDQSQFNTDTTDGRYWLLTRTWGSWDGAKCHSTEGTADGSEGPGKYCKEPKADSKKLGSALGAGATLESKWPNGSNNNPYEARNQLFGSDGTGRCAGLTCLCANQLSNFVPYGTTTSGSGTVDGAPIQNSTPPASGACAAPGMRVLSKEMTTADCATPTSGLNDTTVQNNYMGFRAFFKTNGSGGYQLSQIAAAFCSNSDWIDSNDNPLSYRSGQERNYGIEITILKREWCKEVVDVAGQTVATDTLKNFKDKKLDGVDYVGTKPAGELIYPDLVAGNKRVENIVSDAPFGRVVSLPEAASSGDVAYTQGTYVPQVLPMKLGSAPYLWLRRSVDSKLLDGKTPDQQAYEADYRNRGVDVVHSIPELKKIFKDDFKIFTLDPASDSYKLDQVKTDANKSTKNQAPLNSAPQVRPALIKQQCYPEIAPWACNEGPGQGMTVDGFVSGQVGNTKGGGQYVANIYYYAYASPDHLPVVRKWFDSGDGTPITQPLDSKYKNQRGATRWLGEPALTKNATDDSAGKYYCDVYPKTHCDPKRVSTGKDDAGTNLDCKAVSPGSNCVSEPAMSLCDPTVWGGTPDSCVNRYYRETIAYTCSSTQINDQSLKECTGLTSSSVYPCKRNGVCVYRPRVTIKDNWGICSGTCNGGICIDGACDNIAPDAPNWIRFAGEIVVKP